MASDSHLAQSAIRTCETHEHEDIDMYCFTCKRPMCSKCIKKHHRTHEWETLSKIARQKRSEAPNKCKTIRKVRIPEIQEFLNNLKELRTSISQENLDAIDRVRTQHKEIVAASEAVMNNMVASLEHNLIVLNRNLDNLERKLQNDIKDIDALVDTIAENRNSYTNHGIVELDEQLDIRTQNVKIPDVKLLMKTLTFIKGEFNYKTIESLYGNIQSGDDKNDKTPQLKTIQTFGKDIPQVSVTEYSNFRHGETELLAIAPISNIEAWLHRGKSEGNELMTINGKKRRELAVGMVYPQFTVTSNDDTIHTSYNTFTIHRTTSEGETSTIANTEPLHPIGVCLSQCGGLYVTLVDQVKYTNDRESKRLVRLYTMTGELKTTYQYDKEGKQQLFMYPNCVKQNHNRDICVVDRNSYSSGQLVILKQDLSIVSKYNGPKAKYKFDPTDIACDPNCNIIVSDCVNHTIHMVSPSGQFLKFLLTEKRGIQYPRSLALYNDNLWVGSAEGKVKVLKYKC